MISDFLAYLRGRVVPIILAIIVAMILLGILHKYFPNNVLGQGAEYIKNLVTGQGEGL